MQDLIILSKDYAAYRELIESRSLPDLRIINSTNDPAAIGDGSSAEILLGEPGLIPQVLPKLKQLKWVQSTWAGVDPLLKNGLRRDYQLTNARGVFGASMAEFVFGYLLFFERRILERYHLQMDHQWDVSGNGYLKEKTIGLLGVGSIGKHLASTARHFGMKVHGYTRTSEPMDQLDKLFHEETLLEFSRGLDYVINCLPGTPRTRLMLDERFFSSLSANAIFINIGRGSTVDEKALAHALTSGHLRAAVLDVFAEEPLPADHYFWDTPNLYITSHSAAPSFPPDLVKLFSENYFRYISNQSLFFLVDFSQGY